MPFLVVESTPGHVVEEVEPTKFDSRDAAINHAWDIVAELRELGHRVRRHGMRWVCEQSRRDLGRIIEVIPIEEDE